MGKVQLDGILKLVDVQINPQVFRKISQATAGMPASLGKTNKQLKGAAANTNTFNKSLQKTGQQLSANERAARLLLKRTAQFAILLPTFVTLNRAIQGGVKFLFEFDGALRDIIRIDISGLKDRMEEVGQAALQTAIDFGVTGTEVLGVTRVFKQAGFTIEESQEKAAAAILGTQISTLNAAQATEVFIAAEKQFGAEGKNAISVLDKLAKVEDAAAVNASDVAEAFRTGGNALATFSKSIDDSVGLIAALREQTRKSGREIGTFLKTIQTRVFAAGDARTSLEALGVVVENLDGSLRPTIDVLNDLGTAFDGLTEAQATNAAKSIAGIRQFESLIAVLKSLERANELSAISSQSAGTAEEKRLITDAKLERQTGKLIAQGQALAQSFGEAGLEDALAGALKVATRLLESFTKLSDIIGSIGGSVAPLLALGGVTLGRSVFGLAGQAKAGAGAGAADTLAAAGGKAPKAGFKEIGKQFKRIGNVVKSSGEIFKIHKQSLTSNIQSVAAAGVQQTANANNLRIHSEAIKANVASIKASELVNIKRRKTLTQSTTAVIGLSLAASVIPALFGEISERLREANNAIGNLAADTLDASGGALSMAGQFAILGGKASAVAGLFGALQVAIPKVIDAYDENEKAIREANEQSKQQAKERDIAIELSGPGGKQLAISILQTLQDNLNTVNPNDAKGRSAAISKSFEEIGKELGVTGQQFAKVFLVGFQDEIDSGGQFKRTASAIQNRFGLDTDAAQFAIPGLALVSKVLQSVGNDADFVSSKLGGIQDFISENSELIDAFADAAGNADDFGNRIENVDEQSQNAGVALSALVENISDVAKISSLTGQKFQELDLDALKSVNAIVGLADNVRTLGLEIELAKLGPDALSDNLVRLRQEFLLLERASGETQISLRKELNAAIKELGDVDFTSSGGSLKFRDFLNELLTIPETVNTKAIENFRDEMEQLPDITQKRVKDVIKIIEEEQKTTLNILKKGNDVKAEESKRARDLLATETQASLNAFVATEKFTAGLKKFGSDVTSNVLNTFKNVSLADVEDVLAGQSELSAGVQQLIKNAFSDPVIKAENELQSVTAATQTELNILSKELENVNNKLADSFNSNQEASLLAEKRGIELSLETKMQEGVLAATAAKIKVLEAEREAAEDAAEAESKRLDLLDKLADASRDFDNTLRDINIDFEDFTNNKIADLLSDESDARGELKEAQKEVLDSTKSLSEAYADLQTAQLNFNGALAEAQVKNNLLSRDIAMLTGEVVTFDQQLGGLGNAFSSVLSEANISLEKRISLERQLAEETLSFLQQSRDSIVQAGIGVFGQSAGENQALGQGIQGLQFIADQLGGSFESFLSLTQGELSSVTETLLGLPTEFRQQILDALSFLPSTSNIGGFNPEQLRQAIGQVGAGVSPEAGLPSIEELNNQQVEQLTKLQELAIQDAQLQINQVIAAQEQLAAAEAAVEAAQILEERAREGLTEVRDAVVEEKAILDLANEQRQELLAAVVEADDKNTLLQIEKEATLFAEQNKRFGEVGEAIVTGIASAVGGRLAAIEAAVNVANGAKGIIPNFAGGNLSPGEAAGLLRAGAREKRAMPGGAGLAVANTSEAVIPMRNRGFVPNFQDGNFTSPISAGVSAIKQINETVVAAIARSVTTALTDLQTGGGNTEELLNDIVGQLSSLNSTLDNVDESNAVIQSNTGSVADNTSGADTATTGGGQDVRVTLQTNQNNTVTVSGLESLRTELEAAMRTAANDQVDGQITALLEQLDSVFTTLQERGILTSFGQSR